MSCSKNVFNMKLHEKIMIDENIGVLCVPGGWIYIFLKNNSSVFVPWYKKEWCNVKKSVEKG